MRDLLLLKTTAKVTGDSDANECESAGGRFDGRFQALGPL